MFSHFVKLVDKGLKMHFVLYVYKEIMSDIEICSKKSSHNNKCMQESSITIIHIVVIVVLTTMMGEEGLMITI